MPEMWASHKETRLGGSENEDSILFNVQMEIQIFLDFMFKAYSLSLSGDMCERIYLSSEIDHHYFQA